MAIGTLAQYRANVTSQYGQDGVIAELVRRLDITTGWFVDVGAWDGKQYSNTYQLLTAGWRGVGIEADAVKWQALQETATEHDDRLIPLQASVAAAGEHSLDVLLAATPVPEEFTMLNLDIDSFDWWVWESLTNYRPLIVVIEINSGIPVGLPYIQPKDEAYGRRNTRGLAQGASFTSMVELGHRKGYALVCHAGDLFFVRNDIVDTLGLPAAERQHPEQLFDNEFILRKVVTPRSVWRAGRLKAGDTFMRLVLRS